MCNIDGQWHEMHADGMCPVNALVRGRVLVELNSHERPIRCWDLNDLSTPVHPGDANFIVMLAEFDTASGPTV